MTSPASTPTIRRKLKLRKLIRSISGSTALLALLGASIAFASTERGCVASPLHGDALRFAKTDTSLRVTFAGTPNDKAVAINVWAGRPTSTPSALGPLTKIGTITPDIAKNQYSGTFNVPRSLWPDDDVLGFRLAETLSDGTTEDLDTYVDPNIKAKSRIAGVADEPNLNVFPGSATVTHGLDPTLAFSGQRVTSFLSVAKDSGRTPAGDGHAYYVLNHLPPDLNTYWNEQINPNPIAIAVYTNEADLGFGRFMVCAAPAVAAGLPTRLACSVTNYKSDDDALVDRNRLATVVMDVELLNSAKPEPRFAVYGPDLARLERVALDAGAEKPVPALCLNCHGGKYVVTPSGTQNARFLPFDREGLSTSSTVNTQLGDQESQFRALNQVVFFTEYLRYQYHGQPAGLPLGSSNEDLALIETTLGFYAASGGLLNTSSTFDSDFTPSGWADNPGLYASVVAPYCRSCHIAQPASKSFTSLTQFTGFKNLIQKYVCAKDTLVMPHAQRTYHRFWASGARAAMAVDLGIPNCAFTGKLP